MNLSYLLSLIIIGIFLSSCSGTQSDPASNTPILLTTRTGASQISESIDASLTPTKTLTPPPTKTSTSTPIPPQPSTETPIPTHTSSATPTPTRTLDIVSLGIPSTPTIEYPSKLPKNFFDFNNKNQLVYERVLHGRPITVVFEKATLFSDSERNELSNYIFDTWLYYWNIFQGYRTQQLIVRFGNQSNPEGETSVGFRCDEQWLINEKNGVPESDWYQPLAHGIFHAWNGETILPETCGEKWFVEGITQYYGNRQATRVRYIWEMNQYVLYYKELLGTPDDISLVESGFKYCETTTQKRLFYYRKGALVTYLMDIELIKQGHSLDELLQKMYEIFGLTGERYSTDDVRNQLEAITENDWGEFFDAYILGTEPLPIDKVEFIDR